MARSSADSLSESKSTAVKVLGTPNLHQCLWLPACASHEKLRVTFSTTSNFTDKSLPAVLFMGPMFGSRYGTLLYNGTANRTGVRGIWVDRPGIGGSSPVPLEQRINIWLETVRALLDKLEVKHVALVSHSAGTMYLLNTLYHLRDILDPVAPFAACLGPWVHFEHSQALLWTMASKIPKSLFYSWHSVNYFIASRIVPVGSWSGGVLSSVSGMFQTEPGSSGTGQTNAKHRYGVDQAAAKEVDKLCSKYLFAEGTAGADHEALLCLKKCKPGTWGVCEDYHKYVQDLVRMEKERSTGNTAAARLKIRIFFAESDAMIGKGGTEYFEQIWLQEGVPECIDVQSKIMPGTDHDSVLVNLQKGAIKHVFQEIRSMTK